MDFVVEKKIVVKSISYERGEITVHESEIRGWSLVTLFSN